MAGDGIESGEKREPPYVSRSDDGWYVNVKVQPGAKKSEISGVSEDNLLRIRLAAPAVENKANQALVEFVAKKLQVKKNKVTLTSGDKSRQKRLFIPAEATPDWTGLTGTSGA